MNPLMVQVVKEIGLRGSLHDMLPYFWPVIETTEFRDNWHVGLISEYLEAVFKGEIKDIIFNIPPGCMKSSLVSVMFPAWAWIREPTLRIICASFDQNLALRDARRHVDIINSPMFKECFGDRVSLPRTFADSDVKNLQNGWRYSTSIPKGKLTGYHGDIHIYDDPLKPDSADQKLAREAVLHWAGFTASTRFRDISQRKRILIMQRLHEEDLAGFFEEQGGWLTVRLPMRFEKAYSYPKDPRTEEGELLWPDFKPDEAVKDLEHELGPMGTASQLQQRPAPEGGAIFKKDWLQYYLRAGLPRKFDRLVQSWDMAFEDTETSDWVVGQVWGVKGSDLYLLHQVRGRWDAPATAKQVMKMSEAYPRARAKLIEKKANGAAVMAMLKKRLTGMIAVEPDGGKVSRANAAAPLFEAKNVWLPDPSECTWIGDFIYELMVFPNGKNDDQVDATSQALNYLDKRRLFSGGLKKAIEGGFRF